MKNMSYYITKQYQQRGGEIKEESFNTLEDAKKAIQEKLIYDRQLKITTVYRLYNFIDELQGVFDVNSIEETTSSSGSTGSDSEGGSGGKRSNFNPTPFNMAPRPASVPHNWVKDEDEEEDKEKKEN